jgi:Na+/H+ antiporter NhaC
MGGGLSPRLVPATVFLVSALVSFSTGSSWSTMAVLVPVALPLASGLATGAGWGVADASTLVYATTGSVLTGAVFGDHCSPLSDTTVMSSMAAGCDHVDHVRTQMPYALAVGAVSLLVGDLAVGLGLPVWLSLLVGIALLAGLLLLVARPALGSAQPRS